MPISKCIGKFRLDEDDLTVHRRTMLRTDGANEARGGTSWRGSMTQNGRGMHPEDVKAAIRKSFGSLAAFAAQPGAGAVGIDGKMYDRPHLVRAQRLLASVK